MANGKRNAVVPWILYRIIAALLEARSNRQSKLADGFVWLGSCSQPLALGKDSGPASVEQKTMRQGQAGKIDDPLPPGQQIFNAASPMPGGKFGCCLCEKDSEIYTEI